MLFVEEYRNSGQRGSKQQVGWGWESWVQSRSPVNGFHEGNLSSDPDCAQDLEGRIYSLPCLRYTRKSFTGKQLVLSVMQD